MDLIFGRPRYVQGAALDLVFGGAVTGPALPLTVQGTIVFGGMQVSGTALYDNRLPAYASTSVVASHAQATALDTAPNARWGLSAQADAHADEGWQTASRADASPAAPWGLTDRAGAQNREHWQQAAPVDQRVALVYQSCTPVEFLRAVGWQAATPLQVTTLARHQVATPVDFVRRIRAGAAPQLSRGLLAAHQVATTADQQRLARWQAARRLIPPGLSVLVVPGSGGITPHVVSLDLVFACPPYEAGAAPDLLFGHVCTGVRPPDAVVVVPNRSLYMIVNISSLRRVDNNTVLPTFATTLTLDAESWTWSFAADLPMDAVPLIQRSSSSQPVEVELSINDQLFRAMIESVSRNRSYDDWRITIRGRGLGAVLDSPYAAERTFHNATAMTAQQLALDALTVNGVSNGWAVDWQLTDWLVPAGAWSLQGSPIAAVNRIASAAGGYVQPHPTLNTLRVLPKFPSAPWNWGSLTPDIELPTGPVSTESVEWVDGPAYNRVFVTGTVAGVVGQVTRAGTAGNIVAPTVSDSLITHADAARQRGIAELARGGRWANITLRLPILAETGIIVPGKTIRYDDGEDTHVGITRSVSVQDDGDEIWQSIGVASYVA